MPLFLFPREQLHMIQENKDIQDLLSAFKNLEKVLVRFIKNQDQETWQELIDSLQLIIDDYSYIHDEYSGDTIAQTARNIVRTYLYDLLSRLGADAVEEVINIYANTDHYDNDFPNIFKSVIDSLPGEKYEVKEKTRE
jgi:hypothetical protein